jgi:RNA polymerase sigma-70 factor (ECF subfamily)
MAAPDSEQEWIAHSLEGDHGAFEQLVRKYQHMIHALTFRMTGSFADADDLSQETFIQAHRQLASFRGEASFGSWLYRIALNKSLNWRKRSQNRERVNTEWSNQRTTSGPDGHISGRVQEALLKLNPKQRAAVLLTTYDGLNHAEAARLLGCSETTVSWRLFAARRKLKSLLKDLHQEVDHE